MQLTSYFREVVQELKKVTWPTRKQTVSLTVLVISVTVVVAAYIGGLDSVFVWLTGILL